MNNEFKKAIELAVIENDLLNDFTISDNYSVITNGEERYQVVSENDIDDVCENRKDYDGNPCNFFVFENDKYFFVRQ